MFLQANHDDDVIQFGDHDEVQPSNSRVQNQTNRVVNEAPVKVQTNEIYIRNLGQNNASYRAEPTINFNKLQVEEAKAPANAKQEILQDHDECQSVIQFQDIGDSQSQVRSQVDFDELDDFNAQVGHNSQSPDQKSVAGQQSQILSPEEKQLQLQKANQPPYAINTTLIFIETRAFLTAPILNQGMVQCKVFVNSSGLNKLHPKFYLIKNGQTFLTAKKTSHKFIISTDRSTQSRRAPSFVGQVSKKTKNNYFFWDNGVNPKKLKAGLTQRQSVGTLEFIISKKPKEPRNQKIILGESNEMFSNRQPKWSEKSKSFNLNFYDRVKKASIKNFQLIKENEEPEQIYVQFGKENSHEFNLDLNWPFSPLQAFMVALANYDKKIEY